MNGSGPKYNGWPKEVKAERLAALFFLSPRRRNVSNLLRIKRCEPRSNKWNGRRRKCGESDPLSFHCQRPADTLREKKVQCPATLSRSARCRPSPTRNFTTF
ncbi:hypothetical protein AVEN_126028-1 [Araneus ventricosus]|uniref:Uncharacterized protein n=1 Tax=Araneus ventricosus TaxID=182803 RepID=A0A4Y2RDF7_ARAVE|nr:hypothetical protein AVEN_126028-1 [Araneus ventricosus]